MLLECYKFTLPSYLYEKLCIYDNHKYKLNLIIRTDYEKRFYYFFFKDLFYN
jgi:hypothetical protein